MYLPAERWTVQRSSLGSGPEEELLLYEVVFATFPHNYEEAPLSIFKIFMLKTKLPCIYG